MKIKAIRASLRNLALRKPYTIAYQVVSAVENVFVEIELANGITGLGAANPDPEVVGESPEQCLQNCRSAAVERLEGREIEDFSQLIAELQAQFPRAPGTMAALDSALHDACARHRGLRVVDLYGQKIDALPTSVTIGIMNTADTLAEAAAFVEQGFRVLKIKTGITAEEDIERIVHLHERFGPGVRLRVDANQGYDRAALHTFLTATRHIPLELIEQPLPAGREAELLEFPIDIRARFAADESLQSPASAIALAQQPQPFGIFNIKLMKCGGIAAALDIARVAAPAGIELFWGCNDESRISIAAALHAAFACSHTRYLDLDGSFDLADDPVRGGFRVEAGWMRLEGGVGLGVSST